MTLRLIRYAVLTVVSIVGLSFAVSSPDHAAFWVMMGAVALVMLPLIGVTVYFHLDLRRTLRERKRFANPS